MFEVVFIGAGGVEGGFTDEAGNVLVAAVRLGVRGFGGLALAGHYGGGSR